jgi:hypothetical protein
MSKPQCRLLVVVLSCTKTPQDRMARFVWRELARRAPKDKIQICMVYGRCDPGLPNDEKIENLTELVIDNQEENLVPGMIIKRYFAMNLMCDKFSADFVLNTNMSTFWDWPRLLERLDRLPLNGCYTGEPLLKRSDSPGPFVNHKYNEKLYGSFKTDLFTGTGDHSVVYANGKDLIVNYGDALGFIGWMANNIKKVTELPYQEDHVMGLYYSDERGLQFIHHPLSIAYIEEVDEWDPKTLEFGCRLLRYQGCDHYRVKNVKSSWTREDQDERIYRALLKVVYGTNGLLYC